MVIENKKVIAQISNEDNAYELKGDIIIDWPYISKFDGAFYIKVTNEQCGSFHYEEEEIPKFKQLYNVQDERKDSLTRLLDSTISEIKNIIENNYI